MLLFAFLGNPSGCRKAEGGQREGEHLGSVPFCSLPFLVGAGGEGLWGSRVVSPGSVELDGEGCGLGLSWTSLSAHLLQLAGVFSKSLLALPLGSPTSGGRAAPQSSWEESC